ncbi:hypothetical protein B0T21DRAFT_413790 [Apiosordaria backusii]|uniref:MARVEL domain-containing protein n=1 Tax=Apiosordaria backusii TaxID=314023 RepID=A0AA40B2G9_9PEZI|nr:hypothetical protein B0T21DRAFT_413790 [Apiosordaria backusii]
MAGDDSAAAPPKTEKPEAEIGTVQEKQGNEAGQQATSQQQQSDENGARPALPPRPLPPNHQEVVRGVQGQSPGPVRFQPPIPGTHPQAFIQQPYGPYEVRQGDDEAVPYEIPFHPQWHKAKIVLMLLAVAVCAVIIGLSVATGFTALGDYGRYYIHESAPITGVSASAAILSMLFVAIEMLTICLSRDRRGMHPGWLVTFNLFIGILAAAAFGIMVYYVTNVSGWDGWFRYFKDERKAYEELRLFRILLGFDITLFILHFILFIGACVEANQRQKARRAVQIIQVPFDPSQPLPEGFQYVAAPTTMQYPPAQYPPTPQQAVAMRNGGYAPPQRQIPPQRVSIHGVIPYITPQQAAMYGGYYAPMPTPGQPQPPQQVLGGLGGYYAPVPHNPAAQTAPRRSSRRGGRASVAAASGSGQANAQPRATRAPKLDAALPAIPAESASAQQPKTEEVVSEKLEAALPPTPEAPPEPTTTQEPKTDEVVSEKVSEK